MKILGEAFAQYTQDGDGTLPTRQTFDGARGALVSWRVPINRYIKSPIVFQCADNPAMGTNNDIEHDGFSRSYAVNSTGNGGRSVGPFADKFTHGLNMNKIGEPARVAMVTETTAAYNDFDILRPEAFTKPTSGRTNYGCLFAGHAGRFCVLYCDGHTRLESPVYPRAGVGVKNIWTIDNTPFSPADQAKVEKVMAYGAKQSR